MKQLLVVLYSFLLLITHCSLSKPKVILYKNGEKVVEYEYFINENNDTIKDGNYKSYYSNGKLNEKSTYRNGVREGAFIYYYPNGKIEAEGSVLFDDIYNGYNITYYPNGNKEFEGNWSNNKQYGLMKHYYTNGKPKRFQIADHSEYTIWDVSWDSLGNQTKNSGKVLSDELMVFHLPKITATKNGGTTSTYYHALLSNDSIQLGDSLIIYTAIACLPNTSQKVSVKINKDDKVILDTKCKVIEDECYTEFQHTFHSVGIHQITLIGELWDEKKQLIQKDTIIKNCLVLP